ncbi:TetR/AcrR family transcriptional regulator [Spongiibacter sp. KMU-158]|uniref:TetR/AcrR family transcriptional regulator n=1 Tax=Spongiibacter pelagi TaxID=2760804 RepID=A0A927GXP4_9GAMM|nr:TetR/AcrR family transcriptional regulator [Spongiibacter pelagi]MBD2860222.1 TetR/AcrR family transcriptional regulator [Spongiibacter pelagi]
MNQPTTAPIKSRRVAATEPKLPASEELTKSKRIVLSAALELFAANGYGSTSIRDIAQRANMKSSSLYNHYKSKEDILATLIEIGHIELFRRLRAAVVNAESAAASQLKAFIAANVRSQAEYPMLAVVVNHELHELGKKHIGPAMTLRAQSVELFLDILEKGKAEGVFNTPHPPSLAASAIGAMCSRIAEWFTPEHEQTIEKIESAHVDYALNIVGFNQ